MKKQMRGKNQQEPTKREPNPQLAEQFRASRLPFREVVHNSEHAPTVLHLIVQKLGFW